jgi:hypothetical protein
MWDATRVKGGLGSKPREIEDTGQIVRLLSGGSDSPKADTRGLAGGSRASGPKDGDDCRTRRNESGGQGIQCYNCGGYGSVEGATGAP